MHERLHRLCIVLTYEGWTAMEACLLYIFASIIEACIRVSVAFVFTILYVAWIAVLAYRHVNIGLLLNPID